MSLAYIYNTCWMASCLREARAYDRDSRNVGEFQAALLRQILQRNRGTWFGRKHGFASIRTVRDFQDAVPTSNYDDYRDAIDRIAEGKQNVLTAGAVRLLEPTGGSTSGEKLIPYTAAIQHSFQRAIRSWIWDLYSKRAAVRRGRAYWSISPWAHAGRRTKAGIPIGFDDDAAYLSRWERSLVKRTLVVPNEVARCRSIAAAQYATLFFLLRSGDLSLISVWSPTFLTELLNFLWVHRDALCDDVATGRISIEPAIDNGPIAERRYRPLAERARYLRRIFGRAEQISQCIQSIWPSLALVSCWADGPSLVHANNLRQYLPGIEIQPKGLLATEAFVSVPFVSLAAPALAIRSHFFEFQPADYANSTNATPALTANELSEGMRYRVIVTTDGGLYRYQLHDEVEVVGFKNQAPLLRFIGKGDETSDVVGEKLNGAHVESVLQAAFRELRLSPTFSWLRVEHSSSPGYVLEIADPTLADNPSIQERLCRTVEHGLSTSPSYHYARSIGQLRPLTIELLDQRQSDAVSSSKISERVAAGQRLGDVKPTTISHLVT
jgi:hypothetical protein